MNNIKNIIRIRDMLVTRTFILTFQHTVADDLAIDTTYNIINPIFDSGNLLMSSHFKIPQNPDELKILISDAESMTFWFSVALFLSSIYYVNNKHLLEEIEDEMEMNEFGGEVMSKEFGTLTTYPLNIKSCSLERLKKFIPYYKIRRVTNFVITIFVFIFMKNVMPVT